MRFNFNSSMLRIIAICEVGLIFLLITDPPVTFAGWILLIGVISLNGLVIIQLMIRRGRIE